MLIRIGGLVAVAILILATGATAESSPNGDWPGFGRTPDNARHSPLTQISARNLSRLGRIYTVDFEKLDPSIKNGQQTYPVAVGGRLYVTTNDDGVFALDGATGKVLWRLKQPNVAVFKNFGIVANRGVAYCDDKLFLLTLDMHVEMIDPQTGRLLKRVPISRAVPGAASNFGYSETSAPICANHRVIFGAAGSEYGVRGFVMAYTTNLAPAWPSPYWTVPPEQQSWRSRSRIVGGGAVWTPVTVDTSTDTLYFGTGSATPLYFPSIRPGPNPRTDSLIAVDLKTGATKWWRQLVAGNEWSYDVAQPPLVYDAKVGGKIRRVVSVATMEGVWFAFDAKTGAPIYQRVKVVDRTEHPALRPGQPVVVYPSSLGGVNYSPAAYDPATGYVINAAAETAAVDVQAKLSPEQKRHKFVLGDVFLGLENGNFGARLKGWHDHGSISAIDVATGHRVWKFETPEPERGGVTTTASGLGLAGGGDGVLRIFDVKSGKILWKFQTGHQIAAGPTLFRAHGKEYVAIAVGGTPTSSDGGTASQIQVFGLGGSHHQSPPPKLPATAPPTPSPKPGAPPPPAAATPPTAKAPLRRTASAQVAAKSAPGHISTQTGIVVHVWRASSQNTRIVRGRLMLGGQPVAHAAITVDGYRLKAPTARNGTFRYRIDDTLARRHVVSVANAAGARTHGRPLTASQRRALMLTKGGFSVGYPLQNLRARRGPNGTIVVTGKASGAAGTARLPPVVLYTYRLAGTVTDARGKPVAHAVVVSRTQDRDFWTYSRPSDAHGHYTSFFAASDEAGHDPVPITVQVAVGKNTFASPYGKNVSFPALQSATLDIKLPASPSKPLPVATPSSYAGAVYEGVMIGVSDRHGPIRPKSATWPAKDGTFRLVLPASARGKTLHFWEDPHEVFSSTRATPGGSIAAAAWPSTLPPSVPRNLATLQAPR